MAIEGLGADLAVTASENARLIEQCASAEDLAEEAIVTLLLGMEEMQQTTTALDEAAERALTAETALEVLKEEARKAWAEVAQQEQRLRDEFLSAKRMSPRESKHSRRRQRSVKRTLRRGSRTSRPGLKLKLAAREKEREDKYDVARGKIKEQQDELAAKDKKVKEREDSMLKQAHEVRTSLAEIAEFKDGEARRKATLDQREKELATNANIKERADAYDMLREEFEALQKHISEESGSTSREVIRRTMWDALMMARDAVSRLNLEPPALPSEVA